MNEWVLLLAWVAGIVVVMAGCLYDEGRKGEKPDIGIDLLMSMVWPVIFVGFVVFGIFYLPYNSGRKKYQKQVNAAKAKRAITEYEERLFAEAQAEQEYH